MWKSETDSPDSPDSPDSQLKVPTASLGLNLSCPSVQIQCCRASTQETFWHLLRSLNTEVILALLASSITLCFLIEVDISLHGRGCPKITHWLHIEFFIYGMQQQSAKRCHPLYLLRPAARLINPKAAFWQRGRRTQHAPASARLSDATLPSAKSRQGLRLVFTIMTGSFCGLTALCADLNDLFRGGRISLCFLYLHQLSNLTWTELDQRQRTGGRFKFLLSS